MDISPKPKEWLKKKFVEEHKNYSKYLEYTIYRVGNVIKVVSEYPPRDSPTIATIDLIAFSADFNRNYFERFFFNDPNSDEKVDDLVDIIWYLTTVPTSRNPFTDSSGNSDDNISRMINRNLEYLNHTTILLNERWRNYYGTLDGLTARRYDGATLFYNHDYGTINFRGQPTIHCRLAYVLENKGYVYYEPDDSWWFKDDLNEEGIPYPLAKARKYSCKECGNKFSKAFMYKDKCFNCLGIPKEKVVLHSYSTRAPSLIGFKGTKKNIHKNAAVTTLIDKYYNKVLPTMKYNGDGIMYLGVELEYECNRTQENSLPAILMHLHDHAIIKTDGSLRNGVEIVTCPATYDEQVQALRGFFENFPSDELRPADSCGIHIHVTREVLNASTQGKLVAFINNPANKDFLVRIAGRYNERYAAQASGLKATSILRSNGERYRMLNATNTNTLEFRLFKSTDNWGEMLRFLQFVCAIVEYCKPCSFNVSIKDHSDSNNFLAWLKLNRKDYPELSNFCFGKKEPRPTIQTQQEFTEVRLGPLSQGYRATSGITLSGATYWVATSGGTTGQGGI